MALVKVNQNQNTTTYVDADDILRRVSVTHTLTSMRKGKETLPIVKERWRDSTVVPSNACKTGECGESLDSVITLSVTLNGAPSDKGLEKYQAQLRSLKAYVEALITRTQHALPVEINF